MTEASTQERQADGLPPVTRLTVSQSIEISCAISTALYEASELVDGGLIPVECRVVARVVAEHFERVLRRELNKLDDGFIFPATERKAEPDAPNTPRAASPEEPR